jgi:hypothetical protein
METAVGREKDVQALDAPAVSRIMLTQCYTDKACLSIEIVSLLTLIASPLGAGTSLV